MQAVMCEIPVFRRGRCGYKVEDDTYVPLIAKGCGALTLPYSIPGGRFSGEEGKEHDPHPFFLATSIFFRNAGVPIVSPFQ